MPKRRVNGGSKIRIRCRFCHKTLSEKEVELHVYMCEKVQQEVFNGGDLLKTSSHLKGRKTNPPLRKKAS